MKKFFTLIFALVGFAGAANAATVDDIALLKHSYVLVGDDWTNNGTEKVAKGSVYGNGYFFTPTGHDKATNKGSVDLSTVDENGIVTEEIAKKYGEYGSHLNSLRLKTTQDVFAMSVTAKTKVIIFYENNNAARYPIFAKDAGLKEKYTSADDIKASGKIGGKGIGRIEWTATDDGVVYVGAENQIFVSYVIVEANEAPGTPTVKVGEQIFENGLWFREVTCKANNYKMEGSEEEIPTIVTYTTDGTAPTAASPVYSAPIKCYQDMTVKFQAYQDWGMGADEGFKCDGADYDVPVSFSFDAPAIAAEGAAVTITSPYEGAKNFYTLNGGEAIEGSSVTLTESATVSAYSQIVNGTYTTFTTKSTTKDIYVLNPIKTKKTIAVTNADVVVDEEETAKSTDGSTVYKVENGAISADKMDFFVKDLTFGVLKDAKAQYQVPEGQEAYIQMSNTNITFQVAEGDSVIVKVICTKNSCKNIDADDAAEDKLVNGCTPDRSCYVNVSGTNYCHLDANGGVAADMKLYPGEANIIEFGLGAGTYTFQKYSGTGNILISSIEITPAAATPAETETVLWEGTATVTGWADQPQFLSDGGAELTAAGAKAGDKIRIYASAPDTNWQFELFDGHWHNNYQRFSEVALTNEDGSPRESIIVPLSTQGYVDFAITDAFLTDVTTAAGWGGTFLLNGDGNITVTKVTLVQDGATGIQNVKVQKVQSNAIFNLAGQRVDANYKGVVIMNGKKVILK